MTDCNLAKQCFFFATRDEGKEMHEYLTGLYCAGNFRDCARYRAALDSGPELVPENIFPNEDDFRSLFAWSMNLREIPNNHGRNQSPGRLPGSAPEKKRASSGHLPTIRQNRNQH
jgi:hypothetical protein